MRQMSIWTIAVAIVFAGAVASAQVVVYQDSFDNDGNVANAGIGGGVESGVSSGLSFVDNGDLSAGNAMAGFARINFSSSNSFNLAGGFTLEVTYTQESNVAGASPPFPSNHYSLGLSTVSASGTEEFFSTDSSTPAFDGIGFSLGIRGGNVTEGLLQANVAAGYTVLDDFNSSGVQTETFGTAPITFTLTVDADGNYEYTLGALSGSGTTSLNLDQQFYFRGRTQGSAGNSVQSVALTRLDTEPTEQGPVDIYFLTGQSNAGNFGEINSYDSEGYGPGGINGNTFNNQSNAGFTLSFGRIPDRVSGGSVDEFIETFIASNLDPTNYAVDNLAVLMNAEFGNDIGIFSYGRNGRPLANLDNDNGESWFPGTVAQPFNDELYGSFLDWSALRIQETRNGLDGIAGTADDRSVKVRGIFWFQGEEDAASGTSGQYQTNFENLIARFRNDLGNPQLPIVASEIREVNAQNAQRLEINNAINAVAAADEFVTVIDISDSSVYVPISGQDVHLDTPGYYAMSFDIAQDWIAMTPLLGDVNGDGVVNLLDVLPFVQILSTGDYVCPADTNIDGSVNLLDVDPFVDLLSGG